MKLFHEKCAGLDVHKKTVVACRRIAKKRGAKKEVKTFGTTTNELLKLAEWLEEGQCTHVVMEATGVYWKPVWHILEERSFELILANPCDVRSLPGRKTDVKDATWLAELLAHGLAKASFVPPRSTQELRELTRTQRQLIRTRAQQSQRIQKVLEDANIKIAGLISNILGVSGRRIIKAIINGETDPQALAELGHIRLKSSTSERAEALTGRVTEHHRFLLELHLSTIESLDTNLNKLQERIDEKLEPHKEVVAGKRRSTRIRHGSPWLKPALVQAAWGAVRRKDSYFRTRYYRIRSRRGPKKAIVAVAAAMLRTIYHIIRHSVPYRDQGHPQLSERQRKRLVRQLKRRIQDAGYEVEITAIA